MSETLGLAWKFYLLAGAFASLVLWLGKAQWDTRQNKSKISEHVKECKGRQEVIHQKIDNCENGISCIKTELAELNGFLRGRDDRG